ncbi:hypothetical protein DID88_009997 [Monilinia fructigena]|uniref:BTB domain-containing protein n=1 Tax=Monilinia fructigena TaxID=38457 RepID=A0A395IQP6_9HELO|nr:hypothetical protein DID88_009997 [Monilinia fructigena]
MVRFFPDETCNGSTPVLVPGSLAVYANSGGSTACYHVREDLVMRQGSSNLLNDITGTSHRHPLIIDPRFALALDLLMKWLEDGFLVELGNRGHATTVAEEAGYLVDNVTWPTSVIELCVLCERLECPLIFNDAIDHFALLHTSQDISEESIKKIYELTSPQSSLRRLAADIISSQAQQGVHVRYISLASIIPEFLADMWLRLPLRGSSLYDDNRVIIHDALTDYHMATV